MPKGQYTSRFKRGGRNSGRSIEERFWEKVDKRGPDECWPWLGAVFQRGMHYGQFQMEGRPHPAHRIAWLLTEGPIPVGVRVLHRCDNPPCCNPDHLFLGSDLDNMQDMVAKGRGKNYRGGVFGNRNGTRTKPESRPRGARHPKTHLTDSQVIAMRRLYREGTTQIALTRQFGIGTTGVFRIVSRQTWRHLPEELPDQVVD